MNSGYAVCEGREIHYTEWGADNRETVIAWHGLARTGRDMDEMAAHLAPRYRVICPDTIGRGLSQWSPDPVNEYKLSHYVKIATALVDQLGLSSFHWVGTSMGGILGMILAIPLTAFFVTAWRLIKRKYLPALSGQGAEASPRK